MNKKLIFGSVIIIVLFNFIYTSHAEQKVGEIIKIFYPDYKLLTIDEFEGIDKEFLLRTKVNKNPGFVIADFDGNGLNDFALILNKKTKDGAIFCFVLQTKKDVFKPYEIINYESRMNYICVFKLEPDTLVSSTDAVDTGQIAVTLEHPGIELIYIGKSSIAFYWDKKDSKFKSIPTSD